MVHGGFCAAWVFEEFRAPFEAAGHAVFTPDLPGHAGARPSVAGLSMGDYAKAIATLARQQSRPPILIGHSLGGLVVQLAATRTPVAALILLAPSAPWGVTGATLEEGLSAVTLYSLGPYWLQAVDPDFGAAKLYLFDHMPKASRRRMFDRMTPESGFALWQTLNWWLDPTASTMVSRAAIKAPVIAFAGEKDVIHSPATVRATAERIGGETRVLPGRGHWLMGEAGWEALAADCLAWLDRLDTLNAA